MDLDLKDLQNLQWEWRKRMRLVADLIFTSAMTILVMIIVGLFSFLTWNYVLNPRHRLAHPEVDPDTARTYHKQIMTEPIIALFAAGLAFIHPDLWDLAFLAVPLAFAF